MANSDPIQYEGIHDALGIASLVKLLHDCWCMALMGIQIECNPVIMKRPIKKALLSYARHIFELH